MNYGGLAWVCERSEEGQGFAGLDPLWSSAVSGALQRAPDHDCGPQPDGSVGIGNRFVPGGGVMREGWLRNPDDGWTYRFQRDEKSWVSDPRVFVDKGREMADGSPALLKTRQYVSRELAEGMWKDLVRQGWQKVPAVWGADAEP